MTTAATVLTGDSAGASGASSSGSASGGTAGANGASAGGLPTAQSASWYDSVKDPEIKTWLSSKKYPDAESALKSHWSLERMMGAEKAGRTAVLPKDDNDVEGWKALAAKIGVPDTPDGYKLPTPEGADDGFAKTASKWFHEAGVPPRAANKIAEAWNSWVGEQMKANEAAEQAESAKQMGALEKEWGNDYGAKRELAQRGYREFAKQFGLDDKAALERAESVLGAANLTKFFVGLGQLNSESAFASSDGKGGFSVTKDSAMTQLRQIQADRAAGKINDHAWRTEFEKRATELGKIAYS